MTKENETDQVDSCVATISIDAIDVKCWTSRTSTSRVQVTEQVKEEEVFATMSVAKDSLEYNMSHPRRGRALIFNNKTFEQSGLDLRDGTDVDRDNLEACLSKLGFEVSIFNDPSYKDIKDEIRKAAEEDHSDSDCILIAVLSHGSTNLIWASDVSYKPEMLWDPFTADRCPTLAGKPKIFLIQACLGEQFDSGVTMTGSGCPRTQTDITNACSDNYRVPRRADFLVVFSTAPGYYAWRNNVAGSWFIQSFTKVLGTNYSSDQPDLLTMMTYTARNVAMNFESSNPMNSDLDGHKQVPFITSTLIREVYFKEK